MSVRVRMVDLARAAPDGTVVVVDVLRAFTLVPWFFARGAARVLAVAEREHARRLARTELPGALLAGEEGGRPVDGFDLGNSPSAIVDADLTGRTIVHRTSAGTQGLAATRGSELVLAASLVNARATATHLAALGVPEVTFVVTGASLGRGGDEDRACAELIAARIAGEEPDLVPLLARVAASEAGRLFTPEGPAWAPVADLALACEVDRFDVVLTATPDDALDAIEVRASRPGHAPSAAGRARA